MNKLTMAATAASSTVLISMTSMSMGASPFADRPGGFLGSPPTNVVHQDVTRQITCRVRGDDLFITNFGNATDLSGRGAAWSSPATGDGGVVLLPFIAPGQEVMFAGVLTDFAYSGSPCDIGLV